MGKEVEIAGFSYAPAQEEDLTGTIYKYNFYVSRDGKDWMKCDATGEFSNIMHNPVPYLYVSERLIQPVILNWSLLPK